jgi:hypothetical protein
MREQKITLGEMRESGVRGLLVYCSDYRCSHLVKLRSPDVDRRAKSIRLSNLEPRFVCKQCGTRGADAADLPVKAPSFVAGAAPFSWTGVYVGGNVSGA